MANLTVTAVCNMRCPYCFATAHMQDIQQSQDETFISMAAFARQLDFLQRSQIDQVRLIGGEPTLHPQFPELVACARQRGMALLVFSHGLIPERALACLEALPESACLVLINTNATKAANGPTSAEMARRRQTMRRLGQRALPGFNIYTPHFDLDFLLPLIAESGCRRAVRLGLAQPIWNGNNRYLHPKHYPQVGTSIAQFARRAAGAGVRVEFDCGFVRCMFAEDDLVALQQAQADIGWRCNPILDVSMDGQAIHCFPLTGRVQTPLFAAPLSAAPNATALRAQLAAQTAPYRAAGIYRECSTCVFKQRGECTGGCLSQTMRRFHHDPFRVTVYK